MARSDSQAAWFDAGFEPAIVDGARVYRGVLLHGGRTADGDVLDDVWVLDVGVVEPTYGQCPWHKVHGGTLNSQHGRFGAALVFEPTDRAFVLTGGYGLVDNPLALRAKPEVYKVPLDALGPFDAPATVALRSAGPITYEGLPAPLCTLPWGADCFEQPSCDATGDRVWQQPCASKHFVAYAECTGPDAFTGHLPAVFAACFDEDPACRQPTFGAPEGLARHGAAAISDGRVVVFGGTTGCTGACDAFDKVFHTGYDGPRVGLELAGNTKTYPVGGVADGSDWSAVRPSDWPTEASWSLHGFGVAPLDRYYDVSTRRWRGGAARERVALFGGSGFQLPPPTYEHAVALEWTPGGTTYCSLGTSRGPMGVLHGSPDFRFASQGWTASGAIRDAIAGLPAQPVTWVDLARPMARFEPSKVAGLPPLYRPAVTSVGKDAAVVAGGESAKGMNVDIHLVRFDDPANPTATLLPAQWQGFGGWAVHDAVKSRVFLFGGTGDAEVTVVELGSAVAADPLYEFVAGSGAAAKHVGIEVTWDGNEWSFAYDAVLRHTCRASAPDCITETLILGMESVDLPGNISSARFRVTYLASSIEGLDQNVTVELPPAYRARNDDVMATLKLPAYLADGNEIRVQVDYVAEPISKATFADASAARLLACFPIAGATPGPCTGAVTQGWWVYVPVIPLHDGLRPDGSRSWLGNHRIDAVVTTSVPVTHLALGAGPGSAEGAVTAGLRERTALVSDVQHRNLTVVAVPETHSVGTVGARTSAGGPATVHLYAHASQIGDAQLALADLASRMPDFTSLLRGFTSEDQHHLYLPASTEVYGINVGSGLSVNAMTPLGDGLTVTWHELAHDLFGYRTLDSGPRWFLEGMATLVSETIVPEHRIHTDTDKGEAELRRLTEDEESCDLTHATDMGTMSYAVPTYQLEQLHLAVSAQRGDAAMWTEWVNLLSAHRFTELKDEDLSAWIEGLLPGFYAERIRLPGDGNEPCQGYPILEHHVFCMEPNPVSGAYLGETGALQATQVQHLDYGAKWRSVFSHVPYSYQLVQTVSGAPLLESGTFGEIETWPPPAIDAWRVLENSETLIETWRLDPTLSQVPPDHDVYFAFLTGDDLHVRGLVSSEPSRWSWSWWPPGPCPPHLISP